MSKKERKKERKKEEKEEEKILQNHQFTLIRHFIEFVL